jgi:hypothetical protein
LVALIQGREDHPRLPPEPLLRAISSGLRHARHNVHMRATLIRAFAFFIFASAYGAVLPLIARNQVAGGPALYGFLLAAIGIGAVSAMRWKLQTAATLDLTPSMHWPEPIVSSEIDSDRGPVMVTVEYRIKPADRTAFLAALAKLADERRHVRLDRVRGRSASRSLRRNVLARLLAPAPAST